MNVHALAVTILAALLAVLTLASSASAAEGGNWVLWAFATHEGRRTVREPVDAFPTKVECLEGGYERLRRPNSSGITLDVDANALRTPDGWSVTFRCLPDSIDPRAPK